jgi:two-component system, cell cycle response regulator
MPSFASVTVLLASADPHLAQQLQRTFLALGQTFEAMTSGDELLAAMDAPEGTGTPPGILLLDARLPGAANGRLLAALHERGARRRWAMALIAEQILDEWIARLREGVIDDIVPRSADAAAWQAHLSTMQRGHALYRELESLRENSLLEVKHDPVTGVLNRDTMLTVLFRETDRVLRLHGPLSVMALGLDDFPQRAEEPGGGSADQLLREVARRASRTLRAYDSLGRLGYDEFLLILPGCSTVNAVMLAERLRGEVFGEPFWVKRAAHEIVEARLSCCFGIALSRGRSPVVVTREAEQMLGQARQQGAGTIRIAGDAMGNRTEAGVARLFPEVETLAR